MFLRDEVGREGLVRFFLTPAGDEVRRAVEDVLMAVPGNVDPCALQRVHGYRMFALELLTIAREADERRDPSDQRNPGTGRRAEPGPARGRRSLRRVSPA